MLIRNVTDEDLENALRATNEVFGGNIAFFFKEHAGRTRRGGDKYNVRLAVNNSRGPGAAIAHSGRRTRSACWHAHGTFFNSLPPEAEILSAREVGIHRPGDDWLDYNVGSMMEPLYASEACECERAWPTRPRQPRPPRPIPPRTPPGVKEWRPE